MQLFGGGMSQGREQVVQRPRGRNTAAMFGENQGEHGIRMIPSQERVIGKEDKEPTDPG